MDGTTLELPFAGIRTWDRIERYLDVRPDRRPRHETRNFHASQILGMCPILDYWRRTWAKEVRKAKGKKKEELKELLFAAQYAGKFNGETEAILDTGTVIHTQVQFYYGLTGLLVGAWRCPVCGHVERKDEPMQMPRVVVRGARGHKMHDWAECPKCGLNGAVWPHWLYVEPHSEDKAEWIEGSTDGFIDYPFDGTVYKGILEIKTINENGFLGKYGEGLPQKKHVFQASIYMRLFGRQWALIVYFNKNKSQTKEFLVPQDTSAWPLAVRKGRAVRQGLKAAKPPTSEWRTCNNVKDPAARACPACGRCWGKTAPKNFMSA